MPITERERLICAALRVIRADHYQPDDDPNADAEAEYADDRLTEAARAFVNALDTPHQAADDDPRTAFINALRELAAFLTAHRDVPVPSFDALTIFPRAATDDEERAMVDAAAKAMGTTAAGDTHYRAKVEFGPLTYEVVTISHRYMEEHTERTRLGREAFEAQREAAAPVTGAAA